MGKMMVMMAVVGVMVMGSVGDGVGDGDGV